MNTTTGINPWCWRGKGSKHPDDKIFTDMENLLTEIDEGLQFCWKSLNMHDLRSFQIILDINKIQS